VRAADWTNEHHDEAGQIFAKRRGLDPQYAGSWQYYEHGLVPGNEQIQWWIDLLVREGKLKKDQIQASDVYTNTFNPYVGKRGSSSRGVQSALEALGGRCNRSPVGV